MFLVLSILRQHCCLAKVSIALCQTLIFCFKLASNVWIYVEEFMLVSFVMDYIQCGYVRQNEKRGRWNYPISLNDTTHQYVGDDHS